MSRPPNVVLVVTDQQRYDSLGSTGNRFAETPRLDRLSQAGGARCFDRHFVAAPSCMPSRASLLTGLYPSAHGVWSNGIALPRAERTRLTNGLAGKAAEGVFGPTFPSHHPTLADCFAAAGYATSSVGKLHFSPTQADPVYGCEESHQCWTSDPAMADWKGPYYGFQKVELSLHHGVTIRGHYEHWLRERFPGAAEKVYGKLWEIERPCALNDCFPSPCPVEAHSTSWCAERALAHLDRRREEDRPFFLWVGIPDPHHPFTPPAELAERFAGREVEDPLRPESPEDLPETLRRLLALEPQMAVDADSSRLARRYTDAMNHLIDRAVGRIADGLRERDLWENTIFVFTSDHGDYLGDYGMIRKADYAARLLNHTPLLVHAPEATPGLPSPGRYGATVSNVDLLPTLVEACGLQAPGLLHGEALSGVEGNRRRPVLIQARGKTLDGTNLSLVDDRGRRSWYPGQDRAEVFDHESDPMEMNDCAGRDWRKSSWLSELQAAHAGAMAPTIGRVSPW